MRGRIGKGSQAADITSDVRVVQRSPGKQTLVEAACGGEARAPVQAKGSRLDSQHVHHVADAGLAGSGTALPHLDRIQDSFGAHDVSGVRAHDDGAAREASLALSAQAYAKGNDVAFASAPDLHTAAHEAAHVVQQRGGVRLKGGVGQAGDAYEQHADAVADKVVRGESAEETLSEVAGPPGAARASGGVQFLGQPLDQPLSEGAAAPEHGETPGEQRRYSYEQYVEMWEKEQGRKLTPAEKETLNRGCIGITALNLTGGGNPPLDNAFGTFEQAHEAMVAQNAMLDWMRRQPLIGAGMGKKRAVIFAKLFWSNQDRDPEKRKRPDEGAFQPDAKTGKVDMSGYAYRAQPGFINFDYGFWDEANQCFWHANHMQPGMKVYQSTRDKFVAGYMDFDRIIFCVAVAENYDPALAAAASP